MSRSADIGLPDARGRRLTAIWLAFPLLLLGVWGLVAPRARVVDHHHATAVQPISAGVAGED